MCPNRVNRLILQWHITSKCNQRCKHCYQEHYSGIELTLAQIIDVIEQYKQLLISYANNKKCNFIRGHINITGGEPFVREDFFEILTKLYENRKYFSYGILTNGSLINNESAKLLKKLNVAHIQVSIDGNRKTHDELRGPNNFNQTLKALKILKKFNIRSMISFTAHKNNYKDFSIVAKYARKVKTSKLWTDRLVPIGNGKNLEKDILSPIEAMEFFENIVQEKNKKFLNKFSGTEVYANRSLQFLKSAEKPYGCSAGDSLIVVLENGDIVPCRRMPILCGNVLNSSLSDVYFNHKIMKDLRNENIPETCKQCVYAEKCRGGSKCISYALYSDYKHADPSCPIAIK